jgi:hypothetical protein
MAQPAPTARQRTAVLTGVLIRHRIPISESVTADLTAVLASLAGRARTRVAQVLVHHARADAVRDGLDDAAVWLGRAATAAAHREKDATSGSGRCSGRPGPARRHRSGPAAPHPPDREAERRVPERDELDAVSTRTPACHVNSVADTASETPPSAGGRGLGACRLFLSGAIAQAQASAAGSTPRRPCRDVMDPAGSVLARARTAVQTMIGGCIPSRADGVGPACSCKCSCIAPGPVGSLRGQWER